MLVIVVSPCSAAAPGQKPYISERYVYELDWEADHIDRVIAGLEFDFRGGPDMPDIAPRSDPGRVQIRDGKKCLVGGYFQFDVDDEYIFDTDETITLNLLVDTAITGGLVVTYDATTQPRAVKRLFENAGERWHWERIELAHARFANRRHGVDFGIATLASQMAGVEYETAAMGTEQTAAADRQLDKTDIAICNLTLGKGAGGTEQSQTGKVEIIVQDKSGQPTAVRAGLYDIASGWTPVVDGDAVHMVLLGFDSNDIYMIPGQENWPGKGRYVFYLDGTYRTEIPAGEYQLVLSKGPDYKVVDRRFKIRPGKTSVIKASMQRWHDLPKQGWYSGDMHVHLERRDRTDDQWILKVQQAEDVNLASILAETGWAVPHFFRNYAYGDELGGRVTSEDGQYALVSGQESPVTQELGHALAINVDSPSRSPDYYIYSDFIEAVHRKNGLFGFSHLSYFPLLNVHRGMALEVPFGHVDYAEILQAGALGTKIYYDFLNLGFKLVPSAGTDFPFLNLMGSERNYVHVNGEFTPQAWFDEFERGHTFVTSGPILGLSVNDVMMGDELYISSGQSVRIRAQATVNPDFDDLDRIELVVQGDVVHTEKNLRKNKLTLEYSFTPRNSMWIAIRTFGKRGNPTEAHSAPVYIYVDGNRNFARKDMAVDIVNYYTDQLDKVLTSPPSWKDAETRHEFSEEELLAEYNRQLPHLRERVKAAKEKYAELLMTIKKSN